MNPIKHSTITQNTLLLMLTLTSGTVDAISFLTLGQVFAAAMTGNTVLFGLAAVHTTGLSVWRYIAALWGFISGNAFAALFCSHIRLQSGWSRRLVHVLLFEFMFLVVAAGLMSAGFEHFQSAFVILFSAAMGVQGVIARRVGVNGITTTVITSTLTGLVESIVWHSHRRVAENQFSSTRMGSAKDAPPTALVLWGAAIAMYGLGAALCGVVIHRAIHLSVWLPVLIVGCVVAVGYRAFRD